MAYQDESEEAREETLILMRRLLKVVESLGVVDVAGRQRVAIDAITSGLTLATITTVSSVTNVAGQTALAGMDREMYINAARTTHNNAIRNNLN
jgi:hypothetical protein